MWSRSPLGLLLLLGLVLPLAWAWPFALAFPPVGPAEVAELSAAVAWPRRGGARRVFVHRALLAASWGSSPCRLLLWRLRGLGIGVAAPGSPACVPEPRRRLRRSRTRGRSAAVPPGHVAAVAARGALCWSLVLLAARVPGWTPVAVAPRRKASLCAPAVATLLAAPGVAPVAAPAAAGPGTAPRSFAHPDRRRPCSTAAA